MLSIETPCFYSRPLSLATGKNIILKLDALQPSGSFKLRGLGRLCALEAEKGAKQFVCSSGGNAGLAIAYAGRHLGVEVVVCVPESTKEQMRQKLRDEGAQVIAYGKNWNETDPYAREIAERNASVYIPPFDHPEIWKGNATLIHEVAKEGFTPDAVVVAVGGGGLFCGVAEGMRDVGWDSVPIFTAETAGAATLQSAVVAGEVVTLDKIDTIATSLGATRVAERALQWTQERPVFPQVVTDQQALDAVLRFADDHRVLVEPAAGAALSQVYSQSPALDPFNEILVVVCGGAGVTLNLLGEWKRQLSLP